MLKEEPLFQYRALVPPTPSKCRGSRPWASRAHFRRLGGLERGAGGLASTPHQYPRYPAGTPRGALRFADQPFYGV